MAPKLEAMRKPGLISNILLGVLAVATVAVVIYALTTTGSDGGFELQPLR